MSEIAPICLFVYNRLEETKRTVEALQSNFLAKESIMYIFSDGPKTDSSLAKVNEVRAYINTIHGFKEIRIVTNEKNQGLANSIINGVSSVIANHGKAIVVEDDIITSTNFLDFMNQALTSYQHEKKVFAISGFSYNLKYKNRSYDAALGLRTYSWGWGTWKDRWDTVDWNVESYAEFENNKSIQKDFAKGGSDLPKMLMKQMNNQINSWMIRWVYQQFKNNQFDIFPTISKVINIGFSDTATHTNCSPLRYRTTLDTSNKRTFSFPKTSEVDYDIINQFQKKISIYRRFKYKLLDLTKISRIIVWLDARLK